MFKVVVFASEISIFNARKAELEALLPGCILWCDSTKQCRGDFINQHIGMWLLFLDHDCFVSGETLENIKILIRTRSAYGDVVFSGRYLNSESAGYLQRAHNFIANTWLEQSFAFAAQNSLMLGGVFLVHSTKKIVFKYQDRFWGAEDKVLSYELSQQGFNFSFLENFRVRHETTGTLNHFLNRAYLHGKNDVIYLKTSNNKISYRFWIQKIGFANASLLPLILLHFCIQRAALWFQKARQTNTQ